MRNICFAALLFCCLAACSSLREGDLLFHVASQGNNITDVTPGMTDHVAICLGGDSVVEAIPGKGVVVTPLGEVLHREEGYYVKGRVKKADAKQSVAHARRYLGLPYDSLFLPGNDAMANSEAFQHCLDGGGKIVVRKEGDKPEPIRCRALMRTSTTSGYKPILKIMRNEDE